MRTYAPALFIDQLFCTQLFRCYKRLAATDGIPQKRLNRVIIPAAENSAIRDLFCQSRNIRRNYAY